MPQNLNQNLERYEIESEISRDDLTIAYKAHRISDDYPVTIKVVAPQLTFDSYFVSRFKDVIVRSTELEHPNIAKTFEVGERGDILYVVTEYLDAALLADYLTEHGPLSSNQIINIVSQIASALDYAHSQGVRHGDLSDTNVFIKDGHIWLTDFGVNRAVEGTSLAKKGFAVGNPVYLAPERVRGERSSRTADLYAMGILCYQMLTGTPPLSGDVTSVMHAQVYEQPQAPHLINPNIRPSVSEVVLRMLSKGVELRHSTGAEFARALQVAFEGSAPIRPITTLGSTRPMRPQKPPNPVGRRLIFWVILLTPLLGAALAAGFWMISQWDTDAEPASTPRQIANQIVPTFSVPETQATPTFVVNVVEATTTPIPATPTPPPAKPTAAAGESFLAEGSPFTHLVPAAGIAEDYSPIEPSGLFSATRDPIYLFFDYQAIQPGTKWGVIWKWDDMVLQQEEDIWPDEYGAAGTAWVYLSPAPGFQPGPHTVSLTIEDVIVATVPFTVQAD